MKFVTGDMEGWLEYLASVQAATAAAAAAFFH